MFTPSGAWLACRGGGRGQVWAPRCPRCSTSSRRTRCQRALCNRCPFRSSNPGQWHRWGWGWHWPAGWWWYRWSCSRRRGRGQWLTVMHCECSAFDELQCSAVERGQQRWNIGLGALSRIGLEFLQSQYSPFSFFTELLQFFLNFLSFPELSLGLQWRIFTRIRLSPPSFLNSYTKITFLSKYIIQFLQIRFAIAPFKVSFSEAWNWIEKVKRNQFQGLPWKILSSSQGMLLFFFRWVNKYIGPRKYKIEFVQTLPLIIKNPDRHCAKSYMHKTFLWQNFHFRTISPLEHSWTTVPSPARAGGFLACVCAAFHLIETCCNSGCIEEVPVDLREVKLGSVPATDAVVRPKVPLEDPVGETVRRGLRVAVRCRWIPLKSKWYTLVIGYYDYYLMTLSFACFNSFQREKRELEILWDHIYNTIV